MYFFESDATEHYSACYTSSRFQVVTDVKRHSELHYSADYIKKGKRKIQGAPQLQAAALPRHQEEAKTDKTKQSQIEQTYEKH